MLLPKLQAVERRRNMDQIVEKPDTLIGAAFPKPDAPDKVVGKTTYINDMVLPRMLVAKIKRTDRVHAKILSVDISEAEKVPGIVAIATAENSPKGLIGVLKDNPPLKGDKVRCIRDEIAGVAGETQLRHRTPLRHLGRHCPTGPGRTADRRLDGLLQRGLAGRFQRHDLAGAGPRLLAPVRRQSGRAGETQRSEIGRISGTTNGQDSDFHGNRVGRRIFERRPLGIREVGRDDRGRPRDDAANCRLANARRINARQANAFPDA